MSVIARRVVVAEQFSGGATKLVAPVHSPTYAREPGTSCWRRLAPTDPQALTDIGAHFPETTGAASVARPARARGRWLISLTGHRTTAIYFVDPRTLQVGSISVTGGGRTIVEHVRTLGARPALYSPSPTCGP